MIDPALLERFNGEPVEPPAMSIVEWVDALMSRLAAPEACAIVEHRFGALPLIEALFEGGDDRMTAVRSSVTLGALGLFTPTPERGWGAVAMAGQSAGGMLRVWGEARVSNRMAGGTLVLVRLNDSDQRLAWLDHDAPGVEPRGSRTGGPVRPDAPWWLAAEDAAIVDARVSRPVTLDPRGELHERLQHYAGVWALIAIECARRTVRALRRAARTTRSPGQPDAFSTSQLVAMDLTEIEIETELAAAAARRHFAQAGTHPSGLVLALCAARALAAAAAKTHELSDHLGLTADSPLADHDAAARITAHVGGVAMLENELGHAWCADDTSAR